MLAYIIFKYNPLNKMKVGILRLYHAKNNQVKNNIIRCINRHIYIMSYSVILHIYMFTTRNNNRLNLKLLYVSYLSCITCEMGYNS